MIYCIWNKQQTSLCHSFVIFSSAHLHESRCRMRKRALSFEWLPCARAVVNHNCSSGGGSCARGDTGVYKDDVVGGLVPEQLGTGGQFPACLRVISGPTRHSRAAPQHEDPRPREWNVNTLSRRRARGEQTHKRREYWPQKSLIKIIIIKDGQITF